MSRSGASAQAELLAEPDGGPRIDVHDVDVLSTQQFAAVAEAEIERTRNLGTPLSLLSIRVDRLAAPAPDALIAPALATTCVGLLRATDVVGRVDEATVVVLLPGTSAVSTLRIAERLRTAMAVVKTSAKRRQSTVSIGAVTTRTGRASYRALRSRADAKRDDARSRGGNRVES